MAERQASIAEAAAAGSGRRDSVDCARDPVADGWTVALWAATADLHFCRHLHRDEGEFDAAGRWRRRHLRHCLVGLAVNQARAAAMGQHFCATVRAAARAYAAGGRSAFARRSFEIAFAVRLTARLRAALAAAQESDPRHAAEARENLAAMAGAGLAASPPVEIGALSSWDRAAARQGRAAADNLSLVLRERLPSLPPKKPSRSQLALPF